MDMQSAASAFAAATAMFSAVVAIGPFLPAWCTRQAETKMDKERIRAPSGSRGRQSLPSARPDRSLGLDWPLRQGPNGDWAE